MKNVTGISSIALMVCLCLAATPRSDASGPQSETSHQQQQAQNAATALGQCLTAGNTGGVNCTQSMVDGLEKESSAGGIYPLLCTSDCGSGTIHLTQTPRTGPNWSTPVTYGIGNEFILSTAYVDSAVAYTDSPQRVAAAAGAAEKKISPRLAATPKSDASGPQSETSHQQQQAQNVATALGQCLTAGNTGGINCTQSMVDGLEKESSAGGIYPLLCTSDCGSGTIHLTQTPRTGPNWSTPVTYGIGNEFILSTAYVDSAVAYTDSPQRVAAAAGAAAKTAAAKLTPLETYQNASDTSSDALRDCLVKGGCSQQQIDALYQQYKKATDALAKLRKQQQQKDQKQAAPTTVDKTKP